MDDDSKKMMMEKKITYKKVITTDDLLNKTSFFFFVKKYKGLIKKIHPELDFNDTIVILGIIYYHLTENERTEMFNPDYYLTEKRMKYLFTKYEPVKKEMLFLKKHEEDKLSFQIKKGLDKFKMKLLSMIQKQNQTKNIKLL
jgi:hypothetical protein